MSTPALAAAWIDSWRFDASLDDASLDGASLAGASHDASTGDRSNARPPGETPAIASPASASPAFVQRLTGAIAYEQSYSDDHADWTGGAAMICIHVGPVCLGARARIASHASAVPDAQPDPSTGQMPNLERTDLAALATASLSFRAGQTTISPELGVGIGRLATRRPTATCKWIPPNPMDPTMMDPNGPGMCVPDVPKYEATEIWTPRGSIALRVAIPVFSHVWLDATAAATAAPFGRAAQKMTDAAGTQVAIPADPSTTLQLGIGLRIGTP